MSKPINGIEPTEWAKHLRPWGKKAFWKRHRASEPGDLLIEAWKNGVENGQIVFGEIKDVTRKPKKPFGIRRTYHSIWSGRTYTVVYWYKSSRDRMNADMSFRRRVHWNNPVMSEFISR